MSMQSKKGQIYIEARQDILDICTEKMQNFKLNETIKGGVKKPIVRMNWKLTINKAEGVL